jgi:hypothetical protein
MQEEKPNPQRSKSWFSSLDIIEKLSSGKKVAKHFVINKANPEENVSPSY